MPFHATVNIDNKQLDLFQYEAEKERVYEVFCINRRFHENLIWSEVWAFVQWMEPGNVKRALSDLVTDGRLIKLTDKSKMRLSIKGKSCHPYMLSNNLKIA